MAMRRKVIWSLVVLLVFLGLLAGAAWYILTHEEKYYAEAAVASGPERVKVSKQFDSKVISFLNEVLCREQWNLECSQHEVNSYLAQDFIKSNLQSLLPAEVKNPRVVFQNDEVLIGFHYGTADVHSLVSIRAKVWIPQSERGAIAVELVSVKVGMLPLSTKSFQEEIAERLRKENVRLNWYRKDGHPVAILRLQADKRESGVVLEKLEINQGRCYLQGRTLDPQVKADQLPQ